VTREGLEYLDDQGITCIIDFRTCHENVQREVHSPGWVQVAESEDIYVGFRDCTGTPPHITFASDPPTRFQFPLPKPAVKIPGQPFLRPDLEDYRDYFEFQMQLRAAGVTTLDMA